MDAVNTGDDAWDVTVSGDYAYVADGRSGLRVISVGDPEHPEEVGYYDTSGLYMVRLETKGRAFSRRVVLVK